MTALRAKILATQFVIDCITATEADGFQQHEETEWYEENPNFGEVKPHSFIVSIGGHLIKFRSSIEKEQKQ